MLKICLPENEVMNGALPWTAKKILRDLVLNLGFWKSGSEISKVNALLEIEDELDKGFELNITKEAWGFLKDAMQLTGMNPIPDPVVNRLYMRTYKAVLTAQDSDKPTNLPK